MFQKYSFSTHHHLSLKLLLLLSVLNMPLSVTAEPSLLASEPTLKASLAKAKKTFTEVLQDIATNHAIETGIIDANEQWTRVEFDSYFIDPIVIPVIEPSNANEPPSYMIGIRNTDSNGFEVSLKLCDNSSGVQIPEVINYTVIESDIYLTSYGIQVKTAQRFLWHTCSNHPAY